MIELINENHFQPMYGPMLYYTAAQNAFCNFQKYVFNIRINNQAESKCHSVLQEERNQKSVHQKKTTKQSASKSNTIESTVVGLQICTLSVHYFKHSIQILSHN